ncbi:MAG: D-glycero-beta-D-manno-heptose 1-phosphate adenylyltransferase [Bacteroidales bacterium]
MKIYTKIRSKIVDRNSLPGILGNLKPAGQRIVFTNGCFDILHPGHIHLLSAAKQQGDILIIGLNTDSSVRKLKGEQRPVMDEHSRAILLASLWFVDYIVLFSEETPLQLIEEIGPDVLVKGGDYAPEKIVGSEFVRSRGGKTVVVPLLEGFSSTNFINKTG